MFKLLAEKITRFFIARKKIEEKEFEVYVYCFEMLLSTVFNFVLLLAAALIFRLYYQTAIFSVVFIAARRCMGGYHAKSHLGCMSLLMFFYAVFVVMLYFVPPHALDIAAIACSFVVIFPAMLFAPVVHPDNPVSEARAKSLNAFATVGAGAVTMLSVLCLYLLPCCGAAFSMAYPLASVCITMLAGKIVYGAPSASSDKN